VEALNDTRWFAWLAELGWIDRVALGVVVLAVARGLWIGLLREAFSIGALAAAFVAVRLWTDPAALWLLDRAPFGVELSHHQARIAGGALVALGAMFVVVAIGGFVRKRVHATGLGFVDRVLGGALGGAEGALVVGLALIGVVTFVGEDHEVLSGSRSVELLARARGIAGELPDVAAPPREDEAQPEDGAPAGAAPREVDLELHEGDEVSV
jgi:membrane protein required for colicin V production